MVANKFWYPRGGLENVMFAEVRALEAMGHRTAAFSTGHPDNLSSEWSAYFPRHFELGDPGSASLGQKLRAAAGMFYSREAAVMFGRLMDDFAPDLVHVHGIHRHLSPSILVEARRRGVPVVQTLHDFHRVCPSDSLMLPDATVCEPRRCGRRRVWPAVRYRCVKGDLGASLLSAAETAYRDATRVYERCVSRFISPSSFLKDVVVSALGATVPVDVVPNAVRTGAVPAAAPRAVPGPGTLPRLDGHFLYSGRVSAEKGAGVFLEAARRARVEAAVAGEGPQLPALRAAFPEARFLGRVGPAEVARLLSAARASVVPSTCLENAPLAVLEAMAAGVPVIASATGGIPELVEHGAEGLLVPAGDAGALAEALRALDGDEGMRRRLGEAARRRARADFSEERHMEGLLRTYSLALEGSRGTPRGRSR